MCCFTLKIQIILKSKEKEEKEELEPQGAVKKGEEETNKKD
jgi:hypothetical protein